MTPLISEMVKLTPEPETAMWFDLGKLGKIEQQQIGIDKLMLLPFPRIAMVAIGADGVKMSIWLMSGDNSLTVAGFTVDGKCAIYFNPLSVFCTETGLRFYSKSGEIATERATGLMRIVVAGLLMIHKSSEGYRPTIQQTPINRKRIGKGKPPFFDWHTVKLWPEKPKSEHQGGTHASPRLHDRRGHWRKYPSGKVGWVKNCKVGDASKGVVFKDYEVKQ